MQVSKQITNMALVKVEEKKAEPLDVEEENGDVFHIVKWLTFDGEVYVPFTLAMRSDMYRQWHNNKWNKSHPIARVSDYKVDECFFVPYSKINVIEYLQKLNGNDVVPIHEYLLTDADITIKAKEENEKDIVKQKEIITLLVEELKKNPDMYYTKTAWINKDNHTKVFKYIYDMGPFMAKHNVIRGKYSRYNEQFKPVWNLLKNKIRIQALTDATLWLDFKFAIRSLT